MVEIPAQDVLLVHEVGEEILPHRISEIRNGELNGQHWYLAILEEAYAIVQARRMGDAA